MRQQCSAIQVNCAMCNVCMRLLYAAQQIISLPHSLFFAFLSELDLFAGCYFSTQFIRFVHKLIYELLTLSCTFRFMFRAYAGQCLALK